MHVALSAFVCKHSHRQIGAHSDLTVVFSEKNHLYWEKLQRKDLCQKVVWNTLFNNSFRLLKKMRTLNHPDSCTPRTEACLLTDWLPPNYKLARYCHLADLTYLNYPIWVKRRRKSLLKLYMYINPLGSIESTLRIRRMKTFVVSLHLSHSTAWHCCVSRRRWGKKSTLHHRWIASRTSEPSRRTPSPQSERS